MDRHAKALCTPPSAAFEMGYLIETAQIIRVAIERIARLQREALQYEAEPGEKGGLAGTVLANQQGNRPYLNGFGMRETAEVCELNAIHPSSL
jgi:hypothetical protein